MDNQLKSALGRIMGEMFRMQRATEPDVCEAEDATIYGLLNGIEPAIDRAFADFGFISSEKYNRFVDILNAIDQAPKGVETFTGYYQIEHEVTKIGLERWEAIRIMRHLLASDRYISLLNKMDSTNSPTECRRLEIKGYGLNE